MRISFTIAGPPQPWRRARARMIAPKGGRPFLQTFVDQDTRAWKTSCQDRMNEALGHDGSPYPAGTPLSLRVVCLFPCPAGDHRRTRPPGLRWHTKAQGDADNLAKAVMDAGNGVLWPDDRQIAELAVLKLIVPQGQMPRVEVRVEECVPLEQAALAVQPLTIPLELR